MLQRIEGVVLEIIKYNDKNNVVVLYTRSHGRMSFIVPIGKSKSGKMRNAVLSLMAVVTTDINITSGKELYNLRNVQPGRLWHRIYSHPVKCSLLFFIAEFCGRIARQYPPDEKFWLFLIHSLEILDSLPSDNIASFHIAFLIELLPIMGIRPMVESWEAGDCFDMVKGEMTRLEKIVFNRSKAMIPPEESFYIPLLLRMRYGNMKAFRLNQSQRRTLLDRILEYYSVHLPLGGDLKTLPVLRELFSSKGRGNL